MKKKLIIICLVGILTLGLFSLVGCNASNQKVELFADDMCTNNYLRSLINVVFSIDGMEVNYVYCKN